MFNAKQIVLLLLFALYTTFNLTIYYRIKYIRWGWDNGNKDDITKLNITLIHCSVIEMINKLSNI